MENFCKIKRENSPEMVIESHSTVEQQSYRNKLSSLVNRSREQTKHGSKQASNGNLFFQTQGKFTQQCGTHTLNNLMGSHCFEEAHLNQICSSLSEDFINPHKSVLGGDYDVNVLLIALQSINLEGNWISLKKQLNFEKQDPNLIGFILNTAQKQKFYHSILPISGRHWYAVRKCNNNCYFMLDSTRSNPYLIEEEINNFLAKKLAQGDQVIQVKSSTPVKNQQFHTPQRQKAPYGEPQKAIFYSEKGIKPQRINSNKISTEKKLSSFEDYSQKASGEKDSSKKGFIFE